VKNKSIRRSSMIKSINRVIKMLRNPAGERNKEPILEVLKKYIDSSKQAKLLEISSGTGLHSSFYASHFKNLSIQPTEFEKEMFGSIKAYRSHYQVENVQDPIYLDVTSASHELPEASFDFVLNLNMMHISPIECSQGLFLTASKLLKEDGLLITYGPYANEGILEPESNISFNQSLKSRNPLWGIRDIVDLKLFASQHMIELIAKYDLPSNNKCLIWKKING